MKKHLRDTAEPLPPNACHGAYGGSYRYERHTAPDVTYDRNHTYHNYLGDHHNYITEDALFYFHSNKQLV